MFDIFRLFKPSQWFEQPYDEMTRIPICRQSGMRNTELCEPVDSVWVQNTGLRTKPCPYHKLVHLDRSGKYRVNSDCESVSNMIHKSWFVLPPAQEWYYKTKNPLYKELPRYRADCPATSINSMELIYPKHANKIYVPVELDGNIGKTVFEAAHRKPGAIIYWHLDNKYLGSTKGFHQMGLSPEAGEHTITLVDEEGETISQRFWIVGKEK
jgi:penicillin-binding protein 1C